MSCALEIAASDALGIEAASFCSEAEKDIAESPTAKPERPIITSQKNSEENQFPGIIFNFQLTRCLVGSLS